MNVPSTHKNSIHMILLDLTETKFKEFFHFPFFSKMPSALVTIIRTNKGLMVAIGTLALKEKTYCVMPTTSTMTFIEMVKSEIIKSGKTEYIGETVYCTVDLMYHKLFKTIYNIEKAKYNQYSPWFCSVLVLTEYHLRMKEMNVCIALWCRAYELWKKNPKLPPPPKLFILTAFTFPNAILPVEARILYDEDICPSVINFDEKASKYTIDTDERYLLAAHIAYQSITQSDGSRMSGVMSGVMRGNNQNNDQSNNQNSVQSSIQNGVQNGIQDSVQSNNQ